MPIQLNDSIRIDAGKPLDARLLAPDNAPWASTSAAIAGIPLLRRHIGLQVRVGSEIFHWKDSTADGGLVLMASGEGGGGPVPFNAIEGDPFDNAPLAAAFEDVEAKIIPVIRVRDYVLPTDAGDHAPGIRLAIEAWLDQADIAGGATLEFDPGVTYNLTSTVPTIDWEWRATCALIVDRATRVGNMVIQGNGATLKIPTANAGQPIMYWRAPVDTLRIYGLGFSRVTDTSSSVNRRCGFVMNPQVGHEEVEHLLLKDCPFFDCFEAWNLGGRLHAFANAWGKLKKAEFINCPVHLPYGGNVSSRPTTGRYPWVTAYSSWWVDTLVVRDSDFNGCTETLIGYGNQSPPDGHGYFQCLNLVWENNTMASYFIEGVFHFPTWQLAISKVGAITLPANGSNFTFTAPPPGDWLNSFHGWLVGDVVSMWDRTGVIMERIPHFTAEIVSVSGDFQSITLKMLTGGGTTVPLLVMSPTRLMDARRTSVIRKNRSLKTELPPNGDHRSNATSDPTSMAWGGAKPMIRVDGSDLAVISENTQEDGQYFLTLMSCHTARVNNNVVSVERYGISVATLAGYPMHTDARIVGNHIIGYRPDRLTEGFDFNGVAVTVSGVTMRDNTVELLSPVPGKGGMIRLGNAVTGVILEGNTATNLHTDVNVAGTSDWNFDISRQVNNNVAAPQNVRGARTILSGTPGATDKDPKHNLVSKTTGGTDSLFINFGDEITPNYKEIPLGGGGGGGGTGTFDSITVPSTGFILNQGLTQLHAGRVKAVEAGADVGASTVTENVIKQFGLAVPRYGSATDWVTVFHYHGATDVGGYIDIGGRGGSGAVKEIFFVTSGDMSTTDGLRRAGVNNAAFFLLTAAQDKVYLEAAETLPNPSSRTVGSMAFLPTGPHTKIGTAWQKLVTASEMTDAIDAISGSTTGEFVDLSATGVIRFTSPIRSQSGKQADGGMIVGADFNATTLTANTRKTWYMKGQRYTHATAPMDIFYFNAFSDADTSLSIGGNIVTTGVSNILFITNELASTGTGAVHKAGVDHAAGLYIMRGGTRVHLETATTAPDAASRAVGSMVFLPTGPSVKVGTAWQKLVTASELTDAIAPFAPAPEPGAVTTEIITGSTYTLTSADYGKILVFTSATPVSLTTFQLAHGRTITIYQLGAGAVTASGGGITSSGEKKTGGPNKAMTVFGFNNGGTLTNVWTGGVA